MLKFFRSSQSPQNDTPIRTCRRRSDFNTLLKTSDTKPVFLLKHSIACAASARALKNYTRFAESIKSVDFWIVAVIEDRALAREIAQETGVPHQSPQTILFYKRSPVWDASHLRVTEKNLKIALDTLNGERE